MELARRAESRVVHEAVQDGFQTLGHQRRRRLRGSARRKDKTGRGRFHQGRRRHDGRDAEKNIGGVQL